MKKLLGIVVLGLLLSGCFEDKTKKALEKCADQTFLQIEGYDYILEVKVKEKLQNDAYYYYYGKCERSLKTSEIRFKEKWK